MQLGAAAAGVAAAAPTRDADADAALAARLDEALTGPVLRRELLTTPVPIASIELLEAGEQYLVRVRSRDGATGLAVGASRRARDDVAHPDAPRRPVLRRQGRARPRGLLADGSTGRLQLQVAGAAVLGVRGERRVRGPGPAGPSGAASRSATCWAA